MHTPKAFYTNSFPTFRTGNPVDALIILTTLTGSIILWFAQMKMPFLGSLRSITTWRGRRRRDDGGREKKLTGDGKDRWMEVVGERPPIAA
jgi:hypothetical protein